MFDLNYYDMLRKKEKIINCYNFYSRKNIDDSKRLIAENNVKTFKELKEIEFIILNKN